MRADSPKKRCPTLWYHNHVHLSVRRMFISVPAQGRIKRPRGLGQIGVRKVIIFFPPKICEEKKKSSRPQMSNFPHKIKCRERKKKGQHVRRSLFQQKLPKIFLRA